MVIAACIPSGLTAAADDLFVINFAVPDAGRKRGFIFFLQIWNLSDVSQQLGHVSTVRPKFCDK